MKMLKKDLIIKLKECNKNKDIIFIEKSIYMYMFQLFIKSVAYADDIKDFTNKYVKDCNLFNDMINDLVNKKVNTFDNFWKKSNLRLYSDAHTWNNLTKLFNDLKNIVIK